MAEEAVIKEFVLDFSSVKTFGECYDVINDKLGFDGFGRNLDALVDILRGGFGHFATPEWASLVIIGREHAARIAKKCNELDRWKIMEEIFTDSVKGECGERVKSCCWVAAPTSTSASVSRAHVKASKTTPIAREATLPVGTNDTAAKASSCKPRSSVSSSTRNPPTSKMKPACAPTPKTLYGADPATAHGASMGPSELIPGKLFLGPAPATNADTCAVLTRAGITHIVNVTKSCPFPTQQQVPGVGGKGVVQHRVAVEDKPDFAAAIRSKLASSTAFIRDAITAGGCVYVHCAMGVSRSTTVVLAYRMAVLGDTLRFAFEHTRTRRHCAAPNHAFWKVLCELEASLGRGPSYPLGEYIPLLLKRDINAVFACDKFSVDEVREALRVNGGDIIATKRYLFAQGMA